ncbi:phosphate ABC transporter permease subunit PstC [Thermosipho ferrireducens]|uniref:Phosphate ABC transporter permease subunit PstC n=1 Tax=Thermosipho ferrireducens TaxID=2571116 RepID=A0ABX7S8N2_9BACT|nr:phosphate ABC transporter permease subunit PstC [Thermosipho ferrireducens]
MIFVLAATATVALFFLIYFMIKESYPAFITVGKEIFTSTNWYPTSYEAEYGMLAMIVGTFLLTLFSSLIVLPLGYFIALYLHTYASSWEKNIIKSGVELLSGVPSVIIGAFILMYISPILIYFDIWSTENFLLASTGLIFLSLPYAVSLMTEAMDAVDRSLEESSLALGATKFITTFKITTRASISGLFNGAVLTVNRIIGETMVVLLVGGGAAMIPRSLFDPVRPLTAVIASEMGEVELGSMHYHSLFAAGAILLGISIVLTCISRKLTRRWSI